jgi:DUF4097 and DUF4098 domain-containing protein YvlB
MRTKKIMALIIAGILFVGGAVVGVFGLSLMKFDFKELTTIKAVERTVDITEEFTSISIDAKVFDISLVLTEGQSKVEIKENQKFPHSLSVVDGCLKIIADEKDEWYNNIGTFYTPNYFIVVHLAKAEYDALDINMTTGDIVVNKEFTFGSANVKTTTGDINFYAKVNETLTAKVTTGDLLIDGVSAKNIELKGTSSDISLNGVVATENITAENTTGDMIFSGVTADSISSNGSTGDFEISDSTANSLTVERGTGDISISRSVIKTWLIEATTGDVEINDADGETIEISTTTGKVEGVFSTPKIFSASSTNGSISVPNSTEGGICKVKTTSGRIELAIKVGE